MVFWIIGMSGVGKTTIGRELYNQLKNDYPNTVLIDGDEVRNIFKHDTDQGDYSVKERKKSSDRLCDMCLWLDRQDINVVCCALSIFEESRKWNRNNFSSYFEVYIKANINFLQRERDYKGLYSGAINGEIQNVVGIDIPFPEPLNPDYIVDGTSLELSAIPNVASRIIAKSNINGRNS